MIVKILQKSGTFPAVEYNEKKVRKGEAERVKVCNFEKYVMDNLHLMNSAKFQNELSKYSERDARVKYPQFHVTFSEKGDKMSCEELMEFADKWLEEMGYSKNPLIMYFHKDTDNNHLHVVTSRVGPDGKKIDHCHERRRSQQAIAKILGIDPWKEAEKIVAKSLTYSFRSIGQFRSILESSGYGSYEEGEELKVTKGGEVRCKIPISKIEKSFTLDDDEEREKRKGQLRMWLLRYKTICFKHEELEKLMREKFGDDLVFHGKVVGGKEFNPYGYTIVDHSRKKVYKGSEVVKIKELLEFMPLSKEEKEKDIDFVIDAFIERNHLITTKELNKALAKEVSARVVGGMVVLNGNEHPLRENHARILRENDRLRWVQDFTPRTKGEMLALAVLFKVNADYLSVAKDAKPVGSDLLVQAREVAQCSSPSSVVSNLQEAGFAIVEQGGRHYVIFESAKAIFSAESAGIEDFLKESKSLEKDGMLGLASGIDTDAVLDKMAETGHEAGDVVDTLADKAVDILSIGDSPTTVPISNGRPKDLSKKEKKRGRGR